MESDENEEFIIESIKQEYTNAKLKVDFDIILKKYNIKIRKKGKIASPLNVSLHAKRAIVRMAFHEYGDLFDYDVFYEKWKHSMRHKKN